MHYKMTLCAVLCTLLSIALPRVGNATVELEGFGFEQPAPSNLFSFVGAPESTTLAPPSSQTWPIEVDVAMLAASPQMLLLNLPDRSTALLSRDTWKPRGPGKFLWTGSGDGCSGIFNRIPGHFTGTLACLSGNYRIRSGRSGTHLTRIVASKPPPGAYNDVATVDEPLPPGTESVTLPAHLRSPIVEDRIDVLVLYTPLVRQEIEGQGGNVALEMQQLMDDTQQAMIDSASSRTGFPLTEVHMVHTQEVARGESGTLQEDLRYL